MGQRAHVIVVGNEKGGSGKSTVAMHLVTGLLYLGLRVGSLDLDARQATLTRYVENRRRFAESRGIEMLLPDHRAMHPSSAVHGLAAQQGEEARLHDIILRMSDDNDVLVIDTPGTDHYLSRAGHSYADILITPLNDSFIDLDVLAKVDPDAMSILGPSHYSEMVWDIKKRRALRDGGSIQWVVLRNRLSTLDARNKREMERLLKELARRIGFRLVPGFSERVIYRELYIHGLTLLDLRERDSGVALSMSHIAARQELRELMAALGLPELAERVRHLVEPPLEA